MTNRAASALIPHALACPAHLRRSRGVALMLVMIGLVVCSILTAGFLATQGTAIGITRNERDAQICRAAAQTGVDMCYWLIRNKPDWRETMNTGTWLSAYPVGNGTVTVTASDANGCFYDDPSQPVTLLSTGTYNNRSYSLSAVIRPTGGGTVFGNGNFVQGSIILGTNDLLTQAMIDSYNSTVGPYNPGNPGSNAAFNSNATAGNSLTIYTPSIYRGTYTGGIGAILSNLLNTLGLGILDIFSGVAPTTVNASGELRIPGNAIPPNISSLPAQGAFSRTSGANNPVGAPGQFDSFNIKNATAIIGNSGTYYITGDMTIDTGGILNVSTGVNAVIFVNGNLTIKNNITLTGSGQLAIYCLNSVSIPGGHINNGGISSHLTLYGISNATNSCSQITMTSSSNFTGAVFAPQAAMNLTSGNPKFYGAMIVNSLLVQASSQVHFDQALQSMRIDNITGGSAPPGIADYAVSITGGPGIH